LIFATIGIYDWTLETFLAERLALEHAVCALDLLPPQADSG
jgi:hypothetical protein